MKLADITPTYCSSCHCQNAELRHVDFEAYWDGPVLGDDVKVPIDDLVLCEDCLKAGGLLIGLIDNKAMRTENFELGRALDAKNEEIEEMRKVISDLEHTLGITLSGKIRRGSGRPAFRVPENLKDQVRENVAA